MSLSEHLLCLLVTLCDCCRVLADIFPAATPVHDCVENNRKHWVRKAQLLKVHNNSAQTMSVQEIIALGEGGEMEEKMDTNQQNGR